MDYLLEYVKIVLMKGAISMYKTILFDMDGTLIESNDLVLDIYQSLVKLHPPKVSLKSIPVADVLAKGYPEVLEMLYGKKRPDLIEEIYRIHSELAVNHLKLYPNTMDILESLKSRGIKLYIITSELRKIAIAELTGLSIFHFFEDIIAFEDVSRPKPDPEGIIKLITTKKLNKKEMMFVGDSISDAKAAKDAGILSIYMNWHKDASKMIYFDKTFHAFDELCSFTYDYEPVLTLKMKPNKPFKIVQFTDLHLMNDMKDLKTKGLIKKMIAEHKPDFIVFTGDQTMSKDSPKLYKDLGAYMGQFKTPWSFIFGNHDTDEGIAYEALIEQIKDANYLSYKPGNPKYGYSNYFIEVKDKKLTKGLLFMMDSHVDAFYIIDQKPTWGYGSLKDEQLLWMDSVVNQYHLPFEKVPSSLMFCHIPPYEFKSVTPEQKQDYIGSYHETPCTPPIPNHMMEILSKKNSCKGIFVGHDHYNDYAFYHNQVLLAYGRVSGYYDYGPKGFKKGCRVIELNHDGEINTYVSIL